LLQKTISPIEHFEDDKELCKSLVYQEIASSFLLAKTVYINFLWAGETCKENSTVIASIRVLEIVEKIVDLVGADPPVCPDISNAANKGAHMGAPLHYHIV